MRIMEPVEQAKARYEMTVFKKALLSNGEETARKMQEVNYSQISSVVYREIVKRYKLWKIAEVELKEGGFQ